MTLTEQVRAALERQRDYRAGIYECEKQPPERKWAENGYTYQDFQAGADSRTDIILKLVAALLHIAHSRPEDNYESNHAKSVIADLKKDLGLE